MRLLIVDDNPAIHEDIRRVFAPATAEQDALDQAEAKLFGASETSSAPAEQFELQSAFQGQEALACVQKATSEEEPYSVAIVDMRMPPGWDGLETIAHLWEVDPLLQVVICTAYSDYSWSDVSKKLGRRDNLLILKKPFDGIELHQMVTALARKWDLQRLALEERKSLETRLMAADRMAAVGTLAGGVAHEINNPLAFVITNIEFVSERLKELGSAVPADAVAEIDSALSDTQKGAERIRRIVKDLKTFSRADDRELGPVNVNRSLELSLNMAMNELKHRAQVVKVLGEVPDVLANESRLGQVFVNLLINAAQAIAPGHAQGNEVRVVTRIDGEGQVVIEITDTGCGIPLNIQVRIFEPFFTTKPIGEGTGLGLSICHGIIQGIGGQISVTSEVGKGTTFRVSLPALLDAERPAAVVPAAPPRARRGKILVVDDEPGFTRALQRILGADHQIDVVATGKEALASLAARGPYDVILCDVMMPEMTGIDLYETLRAELSVNLNRLVFVTGGVLTADAREFLSRVPNRVLDKPVDGGRLRTTLGELLS